MEDLFIGIGLVLSLFVTGFVLITISHIREMRRQDRVFKEFLEYHDKRLRGENQTINPQFEKSNFLEK